jgi:tetratricopeptide (TPR) repeat protein
MRRSPLRWWPVALSCVLVGMVEARALGAGAAQEPMPRPSGAVGADRTGRSGPTRFDQVVAAAAAAREANRIEEALALYARAVRLRPSFTEGHWMLGTLRYELQRYAQAREAFRKVVAQRPRDGAAWAFKGVCEFHLGSYETALSDLVHARNLGVAEDEELVSIVRYHTAILLVRAGQFEQALLLLGELARTDNDSPSVVEAMGAAVLRIPLLPTELAVARREAVMVAGRAAYYAEVGLDAQAEEAFEELVAGHPAVPNVHYAYGTFLVNRRSDAAIEQFERELDVDRRHAWARLQLAFEYLRRGEHAAARPWAEQAATDVPDCFLARRALGEVLIQQGEADAAVRELSAGVKLQPKSPGLRLALARAYALGGQRDKAERERLEALRLDQWSGPQWLGGLELDVATEPGRAP